jgi:hypothetical protein
MTDAAVKFYAYRGLPVGMKRLSMRDSDGTWTRVYGELIEDALTWRKLFGIEVHIVGLNWQAFGNNLILAER